MSEKEKSEDKPSGGYDPTPLKPSSGPTYTIKITFHSASNLPVSDYGTRSSDPFLLAQLDTSAPTRHPSDPKLRFRTRTIHKTLEPTWNAEWIVAGIPATGFNLNVRIYDEDTDDHDDKLGRVRIEKGQIAEGWKGILKQEFKVKRSHADPMAYALRWGRAIVCAGTEMHARLVISIELLGKTEEEVGKAYTLNSFYFIHYSPMIGRLAGVKAKDSDQGTEQYNFQANEIQLQGPVPTKLYHRYVDFRPFVAGMFNNKGIRGKILQKALHHQHERIYAFDKLTKYGTLPGPGDDMTLRFLDMVHYDEGGRIFTYVITLDGMFRFTETGKEFGIDLLSKHTMHSDVHVYIAWSGEFFVRRLAKPHTKTTAPDQETHPGEELPGGPPTGEPVKDPSHYELVIDNDSGTYRPEKSLIPILKEFLKKNFPNLHIVIKACDDEELSKWKDQQRKVKTKEGDQMVFGQGSDSGSISSSDEEELEERAADQDAYGATNNEKVFEAVKSPRRAVKEALGRGSKMEEAKGDAKEDEPKSGEEPGPSDEADGEANNQANGVSGKS